MSEVFGAPVNVLESGLWEGEGCPISKEELEESVRHGLRRMKNGPTPGPDRISYMLIRAVRDTRLGRELIEVVVDCLHAAVIPKPWREMRGRSAVDVLYRSVRGARECIDEGGSMVWSFWDVKGEFQNVVGDKVLGRLANVTGTRDLCR